jgi:hypothetical protein
MPAENINIQMAIAKCNICSAVFSFYDEIAPPPGGGGAGLLGALGSALTKGLGEAGQKDRPVRSQFTNLGLPKGFSLENTGEELRIKRRWFSPLFIFLTVFAVFWDGFLLVWFFIALTNGEPVMAAAGSFHALVGIGLTYFVVAGYINSTLIAVNWEHLIIYHYPLPWPGTKTLKTPDIDQLYCKRIRGSKGGVSYDVRVVLKDGKDLKIVGSLPEDTQALFIEQEVENRLKIKDRPV